MQISIALDGPRIRNLRMFAGDELTLSVVVYARDGDASPVAVTNLSMSSWPEDFTFPLGSQFVVPSDWPGRRWYRIRGEIAGVLTTLAYGWVLLEGGDCTTTGGNDYGWRWPYGPPYYPAVW